MWTNLRQHITPSAECTRPSLEGPRQAAGDPSLFGRLDRFHRVRGHHSLLALLVSLDGHAVSELCFSQHAQARNILLSDPTARAAFLVVDFPLFFRAVGFHVRSVPAERSADASGSGESDQGNGDGSAHGHSPGMEDLVCRLLLEKKKHNSDVVEIDIARPSV